MGGGVGAYPQKAITTFANRICLEDCYFAAGQLWRTFYVISAQSHSYLNLRKWLYKVNPMMFDESAFRVFLPCQFKDHGLRIMLHNHHNPVSTLRSHRRCHTSSLILGKVSLLSILENEASYSFAAKLGGRQLGSR